MAKGIDLTGQQFGRLTAVEATISRDSKGRSIRRWKCDCSCGKTAYVATGALRSGDIKSCGCLKRESDKKPKSPVIKRSELTAEIVREVINYDPSTGQMTWKERSRKWFGCEREMKRWNSAYANKPAISSNHGDGYKSGPLFSVTYKAHQIAWLHYHGLWPQKQFDHINGVRSDNRIANLRHVTQLQNGRNQKRHRTNSSGVTGVRWDKQNSKWQASIRVNDKLLHLGFFADKELAIATRKAAERKHGFHPNHGRRDDD